MIDIFSSYLYGLKYIAIVLAITMLISGIDDLFIDIAYWLRRAFRFVTIYSHRDYMGYEELYKPDESINRIWY